MRPVGDGTTIRSYLRAFRRHKTKILLIFCVASAVVVLGVFASPKLFRSEAKLLLRIGRETVTLDPTATLGEVVDISRTGQSEINTALEVLQSRDLIERVVMQIGPEAILTAESSRVPAFLRPASALLGEARDWVKQKIGAAEPASGDAVDPQVALRSEAVDVLIDNIGISAPRESTVILLSVESTSAVMAQRIVKTWTELFMEEHLRLTNTEGSHKFFVDQRDLTHQKLQKAQETLRKAKDDSELVSVEGQRKLVESLKQEVSVERLRNARGLSSSEARCADMSKALEELPERIWARRTEGISDEAHDGMRQRLYELEIRERELLAKYAVNHPLVKAAQRQLLDVRKILNEQEETSQHTEFVANPAREVIKLDLLKEEVQLAALKADAQSLARQHAQIVQALTELNDFAMKVQTLEREVELLDASYRLYTEKSEHARINDAMTSEQITSVHVMQTASFSPDAAGPSRLAMLLAGLLLALVVAACAAIVAELQDPSLQTASEVEEAMELPVLVEIPKSSRQLVHV